MKSEYKQLWILALRSGKFKQGTGFLRQDNNYCCLGVLCEINSLPSIEVEKDFYLNGKFNYIQVTKYKDLDEDFKYYGSTISLPVNFMQHLEITGEDQNELQEMNDNGKSFIEIAEWIEENL